MTLTGGMDIGASTPSHTLRRAEALLATVGARKRVRTALGATLLGGVALPLVPDTESV